MPKFEKGSVEAREYMAKLRAARKPKMAGETRGGKVGDSIKKTFNKAKKAVANVAVDAYHMSPQEMVSSAKQVGSDAYGEARTLGRDARTLGRDALADTRALGRDALADTRALGRDTRDAFRGIGGQIPSPPSRLPSGGRMSCSDSEDDDECKKLHDCPMCRGMGIVKKKRIF
jgi:hypothetical protein